MSDILKKYADLLVNYCLEIQEGEKLYIRTTTLAEPLVREVYREAMEQGGIVDVDMSFRERGKIFMENAGEEQMNHVSPMYRHAMDNYETYLVIRAPFNLREDNNVNPAKLKRRQKAMASINKTYFERTATRDLKRNLCQFPTQASAQEAGMSLSEYEDFVFNACRLYDDNPKKSWLQVRKDQQKVTDYLNNSKRVQYKGPGTDISFSCEGRIWMNSDGQTNMPSGEVYTAPVEDSVNGVVSFSYPAIYMGREVKDVRLWVKDGYVEKWEASMGGEFLDEIFELPGARRFGEAAIGTNYNIQKITRNILFDEKIGGSIHMAIGQSYKQCNGENESSIHWDMITSMMEGEIIADGEKIYEKGKFLL
jgi:aminopeptidase